jgi:hypothetical protein
VEFSDLLSDRDGVQGGHERGAVPRLLRHDCLT